MSQNPITDELLQELEKNPSKAAELDRETRKAVLKRLAEGPQEDSPEEKPVEKTEEVEVKKPEAVETKTEELKGEIPFDVREARKRHQELSDEAHRWEQKRKAAEARLDKAKKAFEDIQKQEAKAPEDFLDDKYQTELKGRLEKTEARLEFLQKLLEDRDRQEIEDIATQHQSKEEQRIFSEIEAMQARFPELKTKKPFAKLNQEYAEFVQALVQANGKTEGDPADLSRSALERYRKDEEFRRQVKAAPPEELPKLETILNVHHKKVQDGGSYMANYLEMLENDGVLQDVMQRGRTAAAKQAATETVKAMKRQEDEIQILHPNEGSAGSGSGDGQLTFQAAASFIEAMQQKMLAGGKPTPDEKAKMKLIRETFGKQRD